ncbi:MAG TPA: lipase maturation factor family protein [Terriglobia bacterium]|nr:lipase maturation factor family protein [Terriglobia bacterium]
MPAAKSSIAEWLFGPGPAEPGELWPRWLWLRALGLIFFSAFYSLAFQVRGLIGPDGILPAHDFLDIVRQQFGAWRFWYAPSLLWFNSGRGALLALCIAGLIASVLLVLNLWPRAAVAVCLVAYLSIISAAQDFASYQSDGMLLGAAFLSLFLAPPGLRPRLGRSQRPSRASLFMLRWLWFQIYFESGVVKLASHDPEWRHLTALDQYYQNGPLPNWIGWYAQQLPHGFQAAITLFTLTTELGLVWLMFLPRRFRLVCFCIVTPFQLGIILTANLAFLNHLVLSLGILLLDDRFIRGVVSWAKARLRLSHAGGIQVAVGLVPSEPTEVAGVAGSSQPATLAAPIPSRFAAFRQGASIVIPAVFLTWIVYATLVELLMMFTGRLPVPMQPIAALEPFRIADHYGLFAVMTRARYEIEFQGSDDGNNWTPYPFRYKPQRVDQGPRIYAPYQPRFDWNLWFASLGTWREYPWVVRTEALLLHGDPDVLSLFAGNPFPKSPPKEVRAVVWEYWFTDLKTKRATGAWWRRDFRGLYGPVIELGPDGKAVALQWPGQP